MCGWSRGGRCTRGGEPGWGLNTESAVRPRRALVLAEQLVHQAVRATEGRRPLAIERRSEGDEPLSGRSRQDSDRTDGRQLQVASHPGAKPLVDQEKVDGSIDRHGDRRRLPWPESGIGERNWPDPRLRSKEGGSRPTREPHRAIGCAGTAASSFPAVSIASATRSFATPCSGPCRLRRRGVIESLLPQGGR